MTNEEFKDTSKNMDEYSYLLQQIDFLKKDNMDFKKLINEDENMFIEISSQKVNINRVNLECNEDYKVLVKDLLRKFIAYNNNKIKNNEKKMLKL